MYPHESTRHRMSHDRPSHDLKLQDVFLNYCRREKVKVSLRFLDQTTKQGEIVGFDTQSLILNTAGQQSLVYKSALISIDPVDQFDYIFNESHRTEDDRL